RRVLIAWLRPRLLRRLAGASPIPPRADARHTLVIALDHVDRLAQAGLRGGDADLARLEPALRRHPHAVVAPHARAPGDLLRLPGVGIDHAAAPAILDHESRRAVRVERGHLVVDVAAHSDADPALNAKVVALADVVEAVKLDHDMMRGVAAS